MTKKIDINDLVPDVSFRPEVVEKILFLLEQVDISKQENQQFYFMVKRADAMGLEMFYRMLLTRREETTGDPKKQFEKRIKLNEKWL